MSTLILHLIWILSVVDKVTLQDSPKKTCLSELDQTRTVNISISCPAGTVISLGEAFFGRNQWGLCVYTENDCTENILTFHTCNGARNCTRRFQGTYTSLCGYATFLTVIYDCIHKVATPRSLVLTTTPSIPRQVWVASWDPVVTPKDNDETGIIVGCAVAVLVTVAVLILAIAYVTRRLVGPNESPSPQKRSRLYILLCTKLGCSKLQCCELDPESGSRQTASLPEVEEQDRRMTPDGAPANEVVQELGQAGSGNNAVMLEEAPVSSDSQRVREHIQPGSNVRVHRLDSVALPNTELSTLC